MKALVIGGGGREHALAWRLAESPSIERVWCTPGNPGMALDGSCIPGRAESPEEMAALAAYLGVDFVVVGPEAPLVAGVADGLSAAGVPVVGPVAAAARLEGSKIFSKEFFAECGIPTADAVVVDSLPGLEANVGKFGYPVALKADGLAAGKGVVLAQTSAEAREQGAKMLAGDLVGAAGSRLLIERCLVGREVSFIVLTDGERVFEFRPTADHKRAYDGDEGPNTGGMGAVCDDSVLSEALRGEILDRIIEPALAGLRRRGTPFRGFLYAGVMLTDEGPQTLEFNVRMGDPETQPLMYRLTGDFGELCASAARGSLDASACGWRDGATACVVMASGGYPGSYPKDKAITGLAAAEATGAKVFQAGTRLRDGALVTSGGRVLGVTTAGATLEAALESCYGAVEKVGFEGAHFRRDIGQGVIRAKQG